MKRIFLSAIILLGLCGALSAQNIQTVGEPADTLKQRHVQIDSTIKFRGNDLTSFLQLVDVNGQILDAGIKSAVDWNTAFSHSTSSHPYGNVGTKTVDEASIASGKVLKYNSTSGKVEYADDAGTTYTASELGIKLSGNQFSLSLDGSTLSQSASGVKVADNTFAAYSHGHSGVYEPAITTLGIAKGGTNNTSYTSNKFLVYDGTKFSSTSYDQSSFAASSHVHTGTYEPAITTLGIAKGGTNNTSYTSNKFLAYDGTKFSSTSYDQNSFAASGHVHTGVYEPAITTLGVAKGGTNATSYTASQLLRMNSAGTAFESAGVTTSSFATASALSTHTGDTGNPHSVTATQVLPSQTGNSGKYLATNGTTASWADVPTGEGADGNNYPTYIGVTGTSTKTIVLRRSGLDSLTAAFSFNTDQVSEGSTNKYYTDTRARGAISSSATGLTYTSSTGVFSLTTGYSIPTTANQTNWGTAYTDRFKWDGGSAGLDTAAARVSLGFGSAARMGVGTTAGTVAAGNHNHSGVYEPVISTLGISKGGTNATSYTASQLLRMNSAGTAFESAGVTTASFATSSHVHTGVYEPVITTLGISKGGTNNTSYTSNKFLAYDGTKFASTSYDQNSFAASGHVHTGVYEPAITTLGVAKGGTNAASYTASQLLRMNSAGTAFESAGVTTSSFASASHSHSISDLSSMSSADLAGKLSDETGSGGGFVRATSPTITGATLSVANKTNVPGQNKHLRFTLIAPNAAVTAVGSPYNICIWPKTDAAITITGIDVTCNADPTTELDGNLKKADAFIGLANAATLGAFDTTSGAYSGSSLAYQVASGKCVYISFDAVPESALKSISFDVTYDYD